MSVFERNQQQVDDQWVDTWPGTFDLYEPHSDSDSEEPQRVDFMDELPDLEQVLLGACAETKDIAAYLQSRSQDVTYFLRARDGVAAAAAGGTATPSCSARAPSSDRARPAREASATE
mmetsp:Transcript_68727/g.177020  ORF Transcript_68727/g.177020 Transcript_68727/m.177020 type:complete len:118 (-) Transcript_68727:64-417(-)